MRPSDLARRTRRAYAEGYAQALRDAKRIALDAAVRPLPVTDRRSITAARHEARLVARRIDDLLGRAVRGEPGFFGGDQGGYNAAPDAATKRGAP